MSGRPAEPRPATPNRSWCGSTVAPTSWAQEANRSTTGRCWQPKATSSWSRSTTGSARSDSWTCPNSTDGQVRRDCVSTPTSACATCCRHCTGYATTSPHSVVTRNRVTLFGESAGGGIVTTLLASPAAEGLFGAAIAQSSPATSVYDAERSRTVAGQFLERLGIAGDDVARLSGMPVPTILAGAKAVFDAVPTQTPGLLAFAPVVDGDIVPEYPVASAREGRTHAVPLIIGTNEHEATVFRWMKSPLMPITPDALRSMFAAIAAEQPGLQLPTEAQITSAYAGLRPKAIGLGMARDIGFRMPTLWFAEGHSAVAPVYLYRFDFTTPMLRLLRLGAAHATELPYVWGNLVAGPKDPTFKMGGLKHGRAVSARVRRRWVNFATTGHPAGAPGEPVRRPYRREDRATLVIDKHDKTVADLDRDLHTAWGSQILNFR